MQLKWCPLHTVLPSPFDFHCFAVKDLLTCAPTESDQRGKAKHGINMVPEPLLGLWVRGVTTTQFGIKGHTFLHVPPVGDDLITDHLCTY